MINVTEALDALINNYNVIEFVHIGCDSYFSGLVVEARRRGLTREFDDGADAIAYAVGRQLVDPDHRVCILMDSLEISRASSKIISLSEVYQIPLLMVIGNHPPSPREPQYQIMGEISKELIMMTMMETGGIIVDLNHEENPFQLPIAPIEKSDSLIYMINGERLFTNPVYGVPSEPLASLEVSDIVDMLLRLREVREFILVSSPKNSSFLYNMDSSFNFYDIGSNGSTEALAQGLAVQDKYPVISIEDSITKTTREIISDKKYLRIILTTYPSSESIKTKEELVGLETLLKRWLTSDATWSGETIEVNVAGCGSYVDWSHYSPEQQKVDLARSLGFDMPDPESSRDYYIESIESINSPDEEVVCDGECSQCDHTCDEGPFPELLASED